MRAAAGAHDGQVRFAAGMGASSHLAGLAGADEAADTLAVECRDVLGMISTADLVKLDIEGGEWEILLDPRFARRRRAPSSSNTTGPGARQAIPARSRSKRSASGRNADAADLARRGCRGRDGVGLAGLGALGRDFRQRRVAARCERYQAIVCSRPSRSAVLARKPNSRSAREVSSQRRGCPSGLEVSQTISPVKPTSSAISSVSPAIEISSPEPRLTGSAPA